METKQFLKPLRPGAAFGVGPTDGATFFSSSLFVLGNSIQGLPRTSRPTEEASVEVFEVLEGTSVADIEVTITWAQPQVMDFCRKYDGLLAETGQNIFIVDGFVGVSVKARVSGFFIFRTHQAEMGDRVFLLKED